MALQFKKASCVAVGAFNIYIVQPQWLATKELIPRGMEVIIESKMDEPGFRFYSAELKHRWIVTPTRIAIETDDAAENCGELVAKLLRCLPETPLVAVGNNVHYQAAGADADSLPELPPYPLSEPLPGDELRQRTFHVAVDRDRCVHNLQLSVGPPGIELLINAHCPVGDGGTDFAQAHAARFNEHHQIGVLLARHHLKVEFNV